MLVEHQVLLDSPNLRAYYLSQADLHTPTSKKADWVVQLISPDNQRLPQPKFLVEFESLYGIPPRSEESTSPSVPRYPVVFAVEESI